MGWIWKSKEEREKEREKERYYLLPGQGGKAYRRKQKTILKCSIAAGLAISVCFALVLYWMSRTQK